jgi:phosphatidylethanolamine-binding protein (PEBP) family uncharacterized protein
VSDRTLLERARRRWAVATALAVVLVSWAAAGCADDGRELAEPRSWQTTTTRPSPPTSAPAQAPGASGLLLDSPDFVAGGPAPVDATCAGQNRHPALTWTEVPEGTAELAITLTDQTDPEEPVLLWLVAGLDPDTRSLAAGALPDGAVEASNDYGLAEWGAPCLDQLGDGGRDLQFRLHALPRPSGVEAGQAGNEAGELVSLGAVDVATLLMRVPADA